MNTKPNNNLHASMEKQGEKKEAHKSSTTQTHKASLGEKSASHARTGASKQAHAGSKTPSVGQDDKRVIGNEKAHPDRNMGSKTSKK
jgi:hypothetical protein